MCRGSNPGKIKNLKAEFWKKLRICGNLYKGHSMSEGHLILSEDGHTFEFFEIQWQPCRTKESTTRA